MFSSGCTFLLLCLYIEQGSGNIPLTLNTKLALHHVLEANKDTTLPSCADKCVHKTDCVSFSFSRVTKVCEMYRKTVADVPSVDKRQQGFTVLIETVNWPKFRTGACWNKPCPEKTTCVPDGSSFKCHEDEELCQFDVLQTLIPMHGAIKVSSSVAFFKESDVFLNTSTGCVPHTNDSRGFIEIQFNNTMTVEGLATRGGNGTWVPVYEVSFSPDCNRFVYYTEGGETREFIGNVDAFTVVTNYSEIPIDLRCMRVHPKVSQHGIFLSLEILACRTKDVELN